MSGISGVRKGSWDTCEAFGSPRKLFRPGGLLILSGWIWERQLFPLPDGKVEAREADSSQYMLQALSSFSGGLSGLF